MSLRLVHSGSSVADSPKLAYGLLYRLVGRQAATLAYIDVFIVLTIAASIMFLLSFIVQERSQGRQRSGSGVSETIWEAVK